MQKTGRGETIQKTVGIDILQGHGRRETVQGETIQETAGEETTQGTTVWRRLAQETDAQGKGGGFGNA